MTYWDTTSGRRINMESQGKKAIAVSLILLVFGYRSGTASAKEYKNMNHAERIRYSNESVAIGDLRALASALGMYQWKKHSYPDDWQADMYPRSGFQYGMPSFDLDIQSTAQLAKGYRYRYTPMPSGCSEPNCTGFILTAVPETPGTTGTRSFFVDESQKVRHCKGGTGANASDMVVEVEQEPRPCQ